MGLYKNNKSAKVGTEIECPTCHKRFIKKSYQQAFCCKDCKDKFWNRTLMIAWCMMSMKVLHKLP